MYLMIFNFLPFLVNQNAHLSLKKTLMAVLVICC